MVARQSGRPLRFLTDRTALAAGMLLVWASAVLPALVQSYTAPKYRLGTADETAFTNLSWYVNRTISLTLLAVFLALVVRCLPWLPRDRWIALIVMLAPWAWQLGRDLYVNTRPNLAALAYPLVVTAVWGLRPRFGQLRLIGYLIVGTAVLSLLMGILTPLQGILSHADGGAVAPEKQILPIGILVGPLTSGNSLGQFLALGMPMIAMIPRRGLRIAGLAITFAAVVWTSNRSSLLALAFALALSGALVALTPVGRRLVSVTALALVGALIVVLPLTVTSDGAFTNRGWIWRTSLSRWRQHEWLGLGSSYYAKTAQLADNIGTTAFHGHNEFVQTLVLGGLVNLILTLLLVIAAVRAAVRWAALRDVRVPVALLAIVAVSSCFEITLNVVNRSFLSTVVVIPLAFILFARPDEQEAPVADRVLAEPAIQALPAQTPVPVGAGIMIGSTLWGGRSGHAGDDVWGDGEWQ